MNVIPRSIRDEGSLINIRMANSAIWISAEGESQKEVSFGTGDTVRVHYKLIEKEKVSGKTKREVHEETRERTQIFEGIVIAINKGNGATMFTVRRVAAGAIGVERIFPLKSPWIRNIELKKHGEVRRAKLYYLRDRTGKAATKIHEATLHVRPATA